MQKQTPERCTIRLTDEQMAILRADRELIARELPDLHVKHERLRDAADESSHSDDLRRAIHSSQMLLHDLAHEAGTDLKTLEGFLTGDQPLTSEVIDRLTKVLNLRLKPTHGKPKQPRANAG